MIVGWVAWKQKKAAEAQAVAAQKQTTAANEQARVAKEQVIAAKQQTAASVLIADRQRFPHICITQATVAGRCVPRTVSLLNNGDGVAINLELRYKDAEPGVGSITPSRDLVIRDSLSIEIDEVRAKVPGLRLTYETLLGTKCTLEFEWDGSQAINQRLVTDHRLTSSPIFG